MFRNVMKTGLALIGIFVGLHSISLYLFNFVTLEASSIVACLLFCFCLAGILVKGKINYSRTPVDKYLVLLVLVYALTSIVAYNPAVSWRGIGALLINNLLIYYLLVANIRSEKDFSLALKWAFFGVGLVTFYSIYQILTAYAGVDSTLKLFEITNNPKATFGVSYYTEFASNASRVFPRPRATFGTSNIVAGYLLTPLMVALSLSIYYLKTNKHYFKWVIAFAALMLLTYLHCFSRAGLGGLMVSFGVLAFLNKKVLATRKGITAIIVLTTVSIILGLFISFPFSSVFGRIFEPSDIFVHEAGTHNFASSTYAHGVLARLAIQMFLSSPILGVGYNNFGVAFARLFDPKMDYMVAHSQYLGLLAETGLVGLAAVLITYFFIIKYTWNSIKITQNAYWKAVLRGFLAGYIGILASNVVGEFYNYQFVWFFIGMMISACMLARKEAFR
jgi:O-antigen ligase